MKAAPGLRPIPDGYSPGIHGLRGLAAGAVFLLHTVNFAVIDGFYPDRLVPSVITTVVYTGFVGVFTFFMISGFLICQSLSHRSAYSFFLSRASRLYPAFIVVHLILFTCGPLVGYRFFRGLSGRGYVAAFVTNLLFLPGVFELPRAQPVAWTLSYEMLFYLSAAVVTVLYRWNRSTGIASGLAIAAALCIPLVPNWPVSRFFLPGLVYYFGRTQVDRFLEAHPRLDLPDVYFVLMWFYWGMLYFTEGDMTLAHGAVVDRLMVPFSFAAAVLFLSGLLRQQGLVSMVLASRVFMWLGTVSYSLYLWHALLMFGVRKVLERAPAMPSVEKFVLFALSSAILTIVMSHYSYKYVEVPGAVWFRTWFGRGLVREPVRAEVTAVVR